jgi:hypothetical protein
MQVIFPPATSSATSTIRIAFAGHREQADLRKTTWKCQGTHPLATSLQLEPASFQFGYRLVGGTYDSAGVQARP